MNTAFQHLHPAVREVIYRLHWSELRPVQAAAIMEYYGCLNDLLIIAPTVGGKTEAIFFPAFSTILKERKRSIQVLSISPLKALINDQFERLERFGNHLGIAVHRWHGDVDQNRKHAVRRKPEGVLIQTPESLEAMIMNRPGEAATMFKDLDLAVIDEVHALLDEERGVHLQSLFVRLFALIGHRPRLAGLSATLGDVKDAQSFLNLDRPESVRVVREEQDDREIRVAVLGHLAGVETHNAGQQTITRLTPEQAARLASALQDPDLMATVPLEKTDLPVLSGSAADASDEVVSDIARIARERSNVVFCRSREMVESLGDRLHRLVRDLGWPEDPFVCHHGSLSKEVRTATESRLKSGKGATAVTTSSLELGINIGQICRILQINPPWTVSSLRQRLGRSGRQEGQPSILRLHTIDDSPHPEAALSTLLYPQLIQAIAQVRLMLRGELEAIGSSGFHLSTLVHQALSVIRQHGAISAARLYQELCAAGPFRRVDQGMFADILRSLKAHDLIDQESEGALTLGKQGETITGQWRFYAAFQSQEEFAVRWKQETIGAVQVRTIPKRGVCLILDGRRWRVDRIDGMNRVVEVVPAGAGAAPSYSGEAGEMHNLIYAEMRQVLRDEEIPDYLDPAAKRLLEAARVTARKIGLGQRSVLVGCNTILWFPWIGTRGQRALEMHATLARIRCEREDLFFRYPGLSRAAFMDHLQSLAAQSTDPVGLAALFPIKTFEKFDGYLSEAILNRSNAADRLDVPSAAEAAKAALAELNTNTGYV